MDFKNYLEKLRALSDQQKKLVLWTIVSVLAVIMGYFWITGAINDISKVGQAAKSISLPKINLPSVPDILQTTSPSNQVAVSSSSAADQTVNWKTYTNNGYGFEIKYPSDLTKKEDSSNTNYVFTTFEDGNNEYPFWIYAGNSEEKNISQIINPKLSDYTEIKNDKISVGGTEWITIEGINIPSEGIGESGSVLSAYTKQGNFTYIFQCINCNKDLFGNDGLNKKAIFDQMISTFKFINK